MKEDDNVSTNSYNSILTEDNLEKEEKIRKLLKEKSMLRKAYKNRLKDIENKDELINKLNGQIHKLEIDAKNEKLNDMYSLGNSPFKPVRGNNNTANSLLSIIGNNSNSNFVSNGGSPTKDINVDKNRIKDLEHELKETKLKYNSLLQKNEELLKNCGV